MTNLIEKIIETSFYRLHETPIGKNICTIDIRMELLPSMTQDDMANFSNNSLSKGGFGYLSLPHKKDIFRYLRLHKEDKQFDDVRKFLTDMYDKYYLQNSTRVDYMPAGKDIITHNYGLDNPSLPDWYKPKILKANFVGPDEFIIQTKTPKKYIPLFDIQAENTNDVFKEIQEINEDFKFLHEYKKDAYLWRLNSEPSSKDTRVVRLDAYPCGFWVDCDRDPQYSVPALGGRIFAEGEAPKK